MPYDVNTLPSSGILILRTYAIWQRRKIAWIFGITLFVVGLGVWNAVCTKNQTVISGMLIIRIRQSFMVLSLTTYHY
jgi:hypothetical protein